MQNNRDDQWQPLLNGRFRQPFSFFWMMVGTTVLAALLRFWAIGFGLPHVARPDEENISQAAVRIIGSVTTGQPSLNPHFFDYPSLFIYLTTLVDAIWAQCAIWTGQLASWQGFQQLYLNDYGPFHLTQRLIAVVFSLAGIWLMGLLGRELFRSRLVGVVSALLLATCYLHVRDSHFGVTDISATTMAIATLWTAVRAFRLGPDTGLRWLYASAVCAGLTAGMKYPVGAVTMAPLLAACLLYWQAKSKLALEFTITLLLALGTFLLTTPYALLDFNQFWQQFMAQRYHLMVGHGRHLGLGWWYHLKFSLWHGLQPTLFLAGLAGMVCSAWQAWRGNHHISRAHWIVAAFGLAIYAIIGMAKTVFVRYSIPLVPIFCLYAAWLVVIGAFWLGRQVQLRRQGGPVWLKQPANLLIGLLLCVMLPSLAMALEFDGLLARKDTRQLAAEWLLPLLQPNEPVATGFVLNQIELPASHKQYLLQPPEYQAPAEAGKRIFFEVPQVMYSPQTDARNTTTVSSYRYPEFMREQGIRFVLLSRTPMVNYTPPLFEFAEVSRRYQLAKHFRAFEPGMMPMGEARYDPIDAFYLPYTSFEGAIRPGPDIWIFHNPLMP